MPEPAGPGRIRESAIIASSWVFAAMRTTRLRMPGDSTWKQPSVCPLESSSPVRASSSGIVSRSISSP